ncbi:MAG: NUDIX domain-containing protein [Candidatus Moranbacteria bacterium]|nr:NUDIX domain-containing protein [Candidatus Moranbacteria bacterium]
MTGHVTGSAFVIYQDKILLIFHKVLQRFLQHGGHFEQEKDSSIVACVQREVQEETGLMVTLHPWHNQNNMTPIHIDTHQIPANEKKNESAHFHHDHAFIFVPEDPGEITLQAEEVENFRWIDRSQMGMDECRRAVMKKNERK